MGDLEGSHLQVSRDIAKSYLLARSTLMGRIEKEDLRQLQQQTPGDR